MHLLLLLQLQTTPCHTHLAYPASKRPGGWTTHWPRWRRGCAAADALLRWWVLWTPNTSTSLWVSWGCCCCLLPPPHLAR